MKKLAASLSLLSLFFFALCMPARVAAVDPFNNCSGGNTQCFDVCATAPESTVCKAKQEADGKNSLYGADGAMTKVVQILAYITGVAAVIVIVISGLRYITSGGDSAGVQNAKNGIIYAVIGLIVALFAQTIVTFVLKRIE